ncbi:ribonuclease HII [Brumimicrobium oceani]|uniref:Ribonuclease HII n=1 Tax=Brumimicrobium oceani TaxID=2100725 RepID=A0A2U2XCA7_9FLAO|nr:ribonuclease HII [Brumimicrobium oceani]PWH85436.1 ribonuclease HII [Brumimicrobium oceani]
MNPFFSPDKIEAGCDEAGRGCLAGPVVAAAVILPKKHGIKALNDSKQISEKKRQELVPIIKEKAIAYGISFIDQAKIDEINILNASFLAMHQAIDALNVRPELLLIDGNRFTPYPNIAHECIIKGDSLYQSIAAASILAKEARDDFMRELHMKRPVYNWQKNKGYPTKEHKQALIEHGVTEYHRKSFTLFTKTK